MKTVRRTPLISSAGVLFNFTVKITKSAPGGESVFFEFLSVFVRDDGMVDPTAAEAIVLAPAVASVPSGRTGQLVNAESLFEKAKGEALAQCAAHQPWDEDVFCLNALRVEVV